MQTPAYKPVRGEARKTPVLPPRGNNRARVALGSVALITFSLGFVFGSGWWVFTAFAIFTAFVVRLEPSAGAKLDMLQDVLAEPSKQESPSPTGLDHLSRSIWG